MPPKVTAHKVKPKKPKTTPDSPRSPSPPFGSGSGKVLGGMRAWNEENEEVMADFYIFPPIHKTKTEAQLNESLDEAAFATRERGRSSVAEHAARLAARILSSEFDSKKLCPKITLDNLCKDGGLAAYCNFLAKHLLEPDLISHPIPRDGDIFDCISIVCPTFTRAVAPTDQYTPQINRPLKQHLMFGTAPSDLTPQNAPFVAATKKPAAQAGLEKLLHCGRCLKIKRFQLYSSTSCQKLHYVEHKVVCGKLYREVRDVPIYSPSSSIDANLHPLRRMLLRSLDEHYDEYWAVYSNGQRCMIGYYNKTSETRTAEIRRCMRFAAYSALRDRPRFSRHPFSPRHPCPSKPPERVSRAIEVSTDPSHLEGIKGDFKMFELTEDDLRDLMKRGKKQARQPRSWDEYFDPHLDPDVSDDPLVKDMPPELRDAMKMFWRELTRDPKEPRKDDDCIVS
ncbi:hypothetical protein JCM8547_004543 [Rhodosporidiobolus lusitaniae]